MKLMSEEQFRQQAPPRPLWKMQEDFMAGLKTTTDNNQPLMALNYAYKAIANLVNRVELLEQDILKLLEKSPQEKPTPKSRVKAEEVSAEV